MQCGAFPKALKFLLLLSSKMLTAYLAGLSTAEFCLHVCESSLCRKNPELWKVILPLPLVGTGLCCTLERHKSRKSQILDSYQCAVPRGLRDTAGHSPCPRPRHFFQSGGSQGDWSLTLTYIHSERESKILWLWIQVSKYTQDTHTGQIQTSPQGKIGPCPISEVPVPWASLCTPLWVLPCLSIFPGRTQRISSLPAICKISIHKIQSMPTFLSPRLHRH